MTTADLRRQIDQLQDRFDALSSELETTQRDAALGVLTRWLAHEVANRLTPIAGYAAAAMQYPDDRELVHKALRHVRLGCERLVELARLLLDLGAGSGDVPCEGASLEQAWATVRDLLSRQAQERNVEIRSQVPPGTRVAMTPAALEHVLLNIASNALKASQDGGVLELSVEPCSTGNMKLIEIRIADNGTGIPEGVLHRAFERGFSNSGGFGLGLALVRQLVEAAGGNVAIHSSLGSGTTVIVRLPAMDDQVVDAEPIG
ncbi:MAG: hypothetical protein Kow0022_12470 [Phycisphaerales bacterium]